MSHALAGEFFTTEPAGKPCHSILAFYKKLNLVLLNAVVNFLSLSYLSLVGFNMFFLKISLPLSSVAL